MRVCLAIDRWSGNTKLQPIAVPPAELVATGLWLDVQLKNQICAVMTTDVAHIINRASGGSRIISASFRPMITISGDKSRPEIGGNRRRAGANSGEVN